MDFIIDDMIAIGQRIASAQNRKRTAALEYARDIHEYNALVVQHSLAHSELASLLGVNRNKLHELVDEAIDKGIIEKPQKDKTKYYYTLKHAHAMMDWLKMPRWEDEYKQAVVLAVANLKGGTGKSSSAIHLAAALALDYTIRPRTVVVDFDPQGSMSSIGTTVTDNDTNTITAVDIALQDYEDGVAQQLFNEGATDLDVISYSLIETHISNLHIVPALTHDQRFDDIYYRLPEEKRPEFLAQLKDKLVAKLKEHYDLVIIDTGPHNNPSAWAAIEAADAVLTPVSPRTLDWDATGLFLRTIPYYVKNFCPSAGKNVKWFKVGAVNTDKTHNRDKAMLLSIMQQAGTFALSNTILRTPAFEEANKKYVTVFDLKKKDSETTPKQIDHAVDSVKGFADEIKMSLAATFGVTDYDA